MAKPHQVNLVIWTNDGHDDVLVKTLEETLRDLLREGVIYVDKTEAGEGWRWLGVRNARS